MADREVKKNIAQYIKVVKELDPELYDIKVALLESKTNPKLLPKIIRAISLLAYGSSYGHIEIYMNKGEITQIKTYESTVVKERAVLLKE